MPAKPDLIVFLCPNGHRLNGPASLEGKPGQCPHCGIKFRVPSRDDPEEEEEMVPVSTGGPGSSAGSGIHAVDTVQELPSEEPTYNLNIEELTGPAPRPAASPPAATAPRATLGSVFARLWEERDRGSVVELHLASGQMIVPERYAKDSAHRDYGVFAVKDADGTYTVTAINWDSVSRVCVRHLARLPKRMFD